MFIRLNYETNIIHSYICEGNLCNRSNLPIEWVKGMIEIPVGQITEETLSWNFSMFSSFQKKNYFLNGTLLCSWFLRKGELSLNEPESGGGAQNSTDWSPPSPPTTSKPATLASFWISGEFVIVTLCYKLSVEWTPVSDLVVERVKKMHKRRTEEIFFPYSILAFWDALYNCQITDFEGSASTCICIAALLSHNCL